VVAARRTDRLIAEVADADADAGALGIFQKLIHRLANGVEARLLAGRIGTRARPSFEARAHRARLIEQDVDIERDVFALVALAGARGGRIERRAVVRGARRVRLVSETGASRRDDDVRAAAGRGREGRSRDRK